MSSLLDQMEEIEESQRMEDSGGDHEEGGSDDDSVQLDYATDSLDDHDSSATTLVSISNKLMTLVEDEEEEGSNSQSQSNTDTGAASSYLPTLSFEDARLAVAQRYSNKSATVVPTTPTPAPTRRVTKLTSTTQRPSLGTSPNYLSQRRSKSRTSFYRQYGSHQSGSAGSSENSRTSSSNADSNSGSLFRRISSALRQNSGASARRHNSGMKGVSFNSSSNALSMKDAVDRLGNTDPCDLENVAAAAAVVAAGANPKRTGPVVQFAKDEHALVVLTLLNITSQEDVDKSQFTIQPVNHFGYPAGQGNDLSKEGPHQYVLCIVKNVHFDEDERYYTVRRMDCQTEQRADPGWMSPLRDPDGISAAYEAARWTEQYQAEHSNKADESDRWRRRCNEVLLWPASVWRRLVPAARQWIARFKLVTRQLLHGEPGFGCRWRCTGINFLVLCSLVYLFLDVLSLAFLPAEHDKTIAVVGFVVWIILTVELVMEFSIRPSNYGSLIASEKAFNPSTARHLNNYHLVCESLALLLFVPQLLCVFHDQCGEQIPMGLVKASMRAVTSPIPLEVAGGRIVLGLTFLRVFGLVRHWKQMWLSHTFVNHDNSSAMIRRLLLVEQEKRRKLSSTFRDKLRLRSSGDSIASAEFSTDFRDEEDVETPPPVTKEEKAASEEDQQLTSAATIGTALMLVNSHRALFILLVIVTIFPAINTLWTANTVGSEQLMHLQALNLASNTTDDCDFLVNAVGNWLLSGASVHMDSFDWFASDGSGLFLVWAQLLPVRCSWQRPDGVITMCRNATGTHCRLWGETWPNGSDPIIASPEHFADLLHLRVGGLQEYYERDFADSSFGTDDPTEYEVRAIYNESHTIALANVALFILLASIFVLGLVGLTVMRQDAGRLVLNPLQRMLRIVVRYAENPLSQTISSNQNKKTSKSTKRSRHSDVSGDSVIEGGDDDSHDKGNQLGSYETVQLTNAISKIADLLRKCWGVAGAGIISSNLARTKDGKTVVFNPTVPGKRVYALFGFVAIHDFSKQLRVLDRDVMILINDVARVVHDEVYRWALNDSGQCNKNLGAAFLMVFRIGDFTEVHDKKKKATEVVFHSHKGVKLRHRRRGNSLRSSRQNAKDMDTLQLASLPGIQGFADRALLGFLKSFAGINRDDKLQSWKKDFRLGAGVGAFSVNVIYGMDAGWAVEGAVGSEYKIDATYLSPHVNMASRMMSAAKQYGVTILLSKAVEELLSKPAREKLRHLDTVYVKGSNLKQPIYTYDARHEGVDFFLFERSPEQADTEADAYSAAIWDSDQDLLSMRQHVDERFMAMHRKGVEDYLEGNWKEAIETLQSADNLMIQTVLDEGYIDYEEVGDEIFNRTSKNEEVRRLQNAFGDGASKCLIQYMESLNGIPPEDWDGVRHLTSK